MMIVIDGEEEVDDKDYFVTITFIWVIIEVMIMMRGGLVAGTG